MCHVAHQCICMQYLLELAKQLDCDPRACISSFFTKIQVADEEYKSAFYSELDAFKQRIVKRAKEKIEEAMEEERLERLGPGGLDPADVFDSLPDSMKKCFESQDIGMLQQVIKELPEEEARCKNINNLISFYFSSFKVSYETLCRFRSVGSFKRRSVHQY